MNRKTKKSGKRLWTASPEPVRSAAKAPSAPKPSAMRRRTRAARARRARRRRAGRRRRDRRRGRPPPGSSPARRRRRAGRPAARCPASASARAGRGSPSGCRGQVGAGVHRREQRALDERARRARTPRTSWSGSPGSWVSAFRPPELTASRSIGKTSGTMTLAGWRDVRTTERRASSRPGRANAGHVAVHRQPAVDARLLFVVAGALERAAGLGEEHVVERWLVKLEVLDLDPLARRARGRRRRGGVAAGGAPRTRRRRRGRARRTARAPRPLALVRGSAGTASIVGRPTSALRAVGVPSATMWPWSMIPTRSARTSASSRYCVVRKTVTPSSLARRSTSSQSAVRLWTSRPVVGSSRKRIRGRCTSASARSSLRFIPPE